MKKSERYYQDLIGKLFGRLTVVEVVSVGGKMSCLCECSCERGKLTRPRLSKVLSGWTKSCGCLSAERARIGNSTHGLTRNYKSSPRYYLWHGAKTRAKKKNIPFDIIALDIHIPDTCPVLGIPLRVVPRALGGRDCSPTLDRLRPEKGYVRDNIAVISYRANRIKSDSSPDELRRVADWLEKELVK